jgi:hypothetical protein
MNSNSDCTPLYVTTLNDLISLAGITKSLIDQFFYGTRVQAPFVASMGTRMTVNPQVFVLLKWIELYPNRKIVPSNINDLETLKNLYIELHLPWENDPILSGAMNLGLI